MPPATSPAGSRTALVTWSVVFAILFVTASVFAIYFYADSTKSREREETLRKQYQDILPPNELSGGETVTALREVRSNQPEGSSITPQTPLMLVAVAQRDELAQIIGGPAASSPAAAVQAAQGAIAAATKAGAESNITVPATDNLANALITMSNGIAARKKEVDGLKASLDAATKENAAQLEAFNKQRVEMDAQLAEIRKSEQASIATASQYQSSKDQSIAQIESGMAAERKTAADALAASNARVAELDRQLGQAKQQLATLNARLGLGRVDTQGPIVRKADGKIMRVPSREVVYIDLGAANSVTAGLTFEVYDKIDGIPAVGDAATDDQLPKGKASLEVVRVGPNNSEARVVRQTPGTQLAEGDLIANLVYDPNVKYNFVVYGEFDMDRNGVATPQDADVVKRLITQWGGSLMDTVNVDTDFVILGKEPVIPTFSREELQDPFNAKKLADAQAAADAYAKVRDTSKELHIPLLNQNRFLALIGYYDQARR